MKRDYEDRWPLLETLQRVLRIALQLTGMVIIAAVISAAVVFLLRLGLGDKAFLFVAVGSVIYLVLLFNSEVGTFTDRQ